MALYALRTARQVAADPGENHVLQSRGQMRAGMALLAAVVVHLSATGEPAHAATAAGVTSVLNSSQVVYRAARSMQNAVVVTVSGRTITIDDRVAVKVGKGCRAVKGDKTKARCTTTKAPTLVHVYTYDQNDSIVNRTSLAMIIDSGTGSDTITGGPRGDYLDGDSGNDKIYGLGGNDRIRGDDGNDILSGAEGNDEILDGAGNDVVRGGNGHDWFGGYQGRDRFYGEAGGDTFSPMPPWGNEYKTDADYFSGGIGSDRADYAGYSTAVSLDLDGVTGDDGMAGEHDTIAADVEDLSGGAGADRLVGNNSANHVTGGDGNDVILGNGGDDTILGEGGRDRLYGGTGDDWLDGSEHSGVDTIVDLIDGGAHGIKGDACLSRTRAQVTRCEIYF